LGPFFVFPLKVSRNLTFSITTKVFKPGQLAGPVQNPGSKFWSGHRVLTGSVGSISILKKIQNGVVLVTKKTKVNGLQPGFWPGFVGSPGQPAGSAGSHRVMAYAIFSSTRSDSSPRSVGSRVDPPGWPGFKTLITTTHFMHAAFDSIYTRFKTRKQ